MKSKKTYQLNDFRLHLDTDRDSVPDWKDCRPFNYHLQHIKPNALMREEIKKLPLYVSDDYSKKKYHVLSKEAEQYAPRARTELLSSIKKYPTIVGDIKKAHERHEYLKIHPDEKPEVGDTIRMNESASRRYRITKAGSIGVIKEINSVDSVYVTFSKIVGAEQLRTDFSIPIETRYFDVIKKKNKEIQPSDSYAFQYVHHSFNPLNVASDIRYKVGKLSYQDAYLANKLCSDERPTEHIYDRENATIKTSPTLKKIHEMKSLESFKNKFESNKELLGKSIQERMYSDAQIEPSSFEFLNSTDKELLKIGLTLRHRDIRYIENPDEYKGAFTGSKRSGKFLSLITDGTWATGVLEVLMPSVSELGLEGYNSEITINDVPIRYWDDFYKIGISKSTIGMLLSRMQDTGLVVRVKKGKNVGFSITELGIGVYRKVKQTGQWRASDYVKPRSEPTRSESSTHPLGKTHTAYYPYSSIKPKSSAHLVLIAIASGGASYMSKRDIPTTGAGYLRWGKKGYSTPKSSFKSILCANDVTTRKLDVTGLITRTKKGFYKLTKRGWKVLELLDKVNDVRINCI